WPTSRCPSCTEPLRSPGSSSWTSLDRDLVPLLDIDTEPLEEREPMEGRAHRFQRARKCRRELPVEGHLVARDEGLEELHLGLADAMLVCEQGIGVDVRLADLALGAVAAQEPVVAKRPLVARPRQAHDLGDLLFEAFQLAVADPQSCGRLEHGVTPPPCRAG